MNCPHCRRGLHYEPSLSTPTAKDIKDKQLVYHCGSCNTLYVFKQISTKLTIGGRLVMSLSRLKRAGYYELKEAARAANLGHPRISAGSLVELPSARTQGDAA